MSLDRTANRMAYKLDGDAFRTIDKNLGYGISQFLRNEFIFKMPPQLGITTNMMKCNFGKQGVFIFLRDTPPLYTWE